VWGQLVSRPAGASSRATAVVAGLGEAGLCGHIDPEGEISVKAGNSFSEHWIIASRVGWGVPTDHWVQRKYVGACEPSVF
jgi:hypothetical protein